MGEGLKLGLYVLYHNNNFNLINIYSTKTLMFCFAVFFFTMLRVQKFFYALLGICKFFFYKFFHSPPPPPTRSTGPSLKRKHTHKLTKYTFLLNGSERFNWLNACASTGFNRPSGVCLSRFRCTLAPYKKREKNCLICSNWV